MAVDLATFSQPVGKLFTPLSQPADRAQFELSAEQLDFYHEYGYVAGVKIFNEDQIAALREQLTRFFDPNHEGREFWYEYHTNESGDPNNVLFHALGAWRISEGFHDLLWNPALTVPASQLLEGDVRFWHDQLFCKPAQHGGVVAWHQDYSYWTRTQPMSHLTCWIGLDDSTRDNGCLQYVPRSHRWPLLPRTDLANNMEAIQEVLTEQQRADFQPVAIELRAGEASFHHPLMVHGSYENRTDRPRRATVINVFRDGVRSAADEPLLAGVPAIPSGELMQGKFFPLLES